MPPAVRRSGRALLRILPPEPGTPALPVTVRPPNAPVLSRMMPLPAETVAVPAVMLRKVRPAAAIVVLATFRPVPVMVAIVLPDPVTEIVPPPVAVKGVLEEVLRVTPPVRLIVAPVLLLRNTPPPAPPESVI